MPVTPDTTCSLIQFSTKCLYEVKNPVQGIDRWGHCGIPSILLLICTWKFPGLVHVGETGSVSSASTEVLVLLDQINASPCLGMSHFYSRMLWIISFFFPWGPGIQSVVAVGALLSAWVVKTGFPLGEDHAGWLLKDSGTTVFLTQRVRNPKGWFQHNCHLEKGKKSVSTGKQRIKNQNIEVKWENNEAKWKTGIPGWPQCWLPQSSIPATTGFLPTFFLSCFQGEVGTSLLFLVTCESNA